MPPIWFRRGWGKCLPHLPCLARWSHRRLRLRMGAARCVSRRSHHRALLWSFGLRPHELRCQFSALRLRPEPGLHHPFPAETGTRRCGPDTGQAIHLITERETVRLTQVTGYAEERVVGRLQPKSRPQDPTEVQPMRRHGQAAGKEAATQRPSR